MGLPGLLAVVAALVLPMSPAAQDIIQNDGSSSVRPLVEALAKGSAMTSSGVPRNIGKSLGTKARIKALNEGKIDIANDMGKFADLATDLDLLITELRERVTALWEIVLSLIDSPSRPVDPPTSFPSTITMEKGQITISDRDIVVEAPARVDFFVDATSGSDANDGTAKSPWRTIDKVNNTTFSPGDVIAFERGEEWRETLTVSSSGTSGNPITFTAYGSGADPLINGADLVTGWTLDSGNVWKASVSWTPRGVFLDGARMNHLSKLQNTSDYGSVASKGAIGVDDWFWDDSSNTLFIYSTSDPDTLYMSGVVEVARRNATIDISSKDFVTIENIEVTYSNSNSIWIKGSSDHTVLDNVTSSYAKYNGVTIQGTSTNTTVENSHMHHNGGYYISGSYNNGNGGHGVEILTTGAGTLVDNNDLHDNAEQAVQSGPTANTSFTLSNNLMYNNHEAGIGLKSGDVTNTLIEGNSVYGNAIDGIFLLINTTGAVIQGNTIYENGGNGIWLNAAIDSAKIYANLIYDNGVIGSTAYTGSLRYGILIQPDVSTTDIEIWQNTIYHSGDKHAVLLGFNADNVDIRNNIIVSTDTDAAILFQEENPTGIVEQNNLVWNSDGLAVINFAYGARTYDLSEINDGTYSAAEGLGQNTVDADPNFFDTGSDDYYLNSTSSAAQTGQTDLGVSTDVNGDFYRSPPNMGAIAGWL